MRDETQLLDLFERLAPEQQDGLTAIAECRMMNAELTGRADAHAVVFTHHSSLITHH
jgi:hypothetical protein